MPVIKRPCTYPRCPNLVTKGSRCDKHKEVWNHTKSASQRGYGSNWRKLRQIVLQRDRFLCQECKRQGRVKEGNQVDHIKPKSQGGSDVLDNLQVLCVECHNEKSKSESINSRS